MLRAHDFDIFRHRHDSEDQGDAEWRPGGHPFQLPVGPAVPVLDDLRPPHRSDRHVTTPRRDGDLDLLFYNEHGVLVPLCPPGLSVGITCQITGTRNIGRDAVDIAALVVTGPKSKTGEFFVRIVRAGGGSQHVKYVPFELAGLLDIVEHDTASGTACGHSNARNVASVGAASWYLTDAFDAHFSTLVQDTPGACNPACLNNFSAGRIPIYLDKYGVRLADGRRPSQPRFTGPDGGNTTFFFADSSFDDDDNDGKNSPSAPSSPRSWTTRPTSCRTSSGPPRRLRTSPAWRR